MGSLPGVKLGHYLGQQLIDREPVEQSVTSSCIVPMPALGLQREAQGARRIELLNEHLPSTGPDLGIWSDV